MQGEEGFVWDRIFFIDFQRKDGFNLPDQFMIQLNSYSEKTEWEMTNSSWWIYSIWMRVLTFSYILEQPSSVRSWNNSRYSRGINNCYFLFVYFVLCYFTFKPRKYYVMVCFSLPVPVLHIILKVKYMDRQS